MKAFSVLGALLLVVLGPGCGSPSGGGSGGPSPAAGRVQGTVMIAPCRPVERAGDPPCPPRPGIVVSFQPVGGGSGATATTDASGRYSLGLPARDYDVRASGGMGPAAPARVSVPPGGTVTLNLTVDSGIR